MTSPFLQGAGGHQVLPGQVQGGGQGQFGKVPGPGRAFVIKAVTVTAISHSYSYSHFTQLQLQSFHTVTVTVTTVSVQGCGDRQSGRAFVMNESSQEHNLCQ